MVVDAFGVLPDGRQVERFTLTNASGTTVSFLGFGAVISSVVVPDRRGRLADVAPGFDTLDGYLADPNFLGALIGRYANRIADGRFELDGVECTVARNG